MDRMKHGNPDWPHPAPFRIDSYDCEDRASMELKSPRLQRRGPHSDLHGEGDMRMGHLQMTPSLQTSHETDTRTEPGKVRKGSIRTAVRKIFGRRSREPELVPETVPELTSSSISPSRHAYHASEPPQMPLQYGNPDQIGEGNIVQRTLSVPPPFAVPDTQRTRSPYAVEFPHSARLKPLALGDPFYAPGSQLRRRRTLPSLQVSESDAAAISSALHSAQETAPPASANEAVASDTGKGLRVGGTNKRWSRSADDLRKEAAEQTSPTRKRSDEIRYWRESYQPNVFHASGFQILKSSYAKEDTTQDDGLDPQRMADPFVESTTRPIMTPQSRRELNEFDRFSPSAIGTEMSRELEDRVAKLESNLQQFSDELRKLTTGRNRSTVLVGGATPRLGVSDRVEGRSPSMLIESLELSAIPSAFEYETSSPARPLISSPAPQTPVQPRSRPSAIPPIHTRETEFTEPSLDTSASFYSADSGNVSGQSSAPQYTFRSLYEMLADERSARRKLEKQMLGLRQQIMDLQYQVSVSSNIHSQRSSYGHTDAMAGSSRLQALLRDTEMPTLDTSGSMGSAQPPAQSHPDARQRMVSRFSGESEVAFPDTDLPQTPLETLETPLEAYQTPRGGGETNFTFATTADTGMF